MQRVPRRVHLVAGKRIPRRIALGDHGAIELLDRDPLRCKHRALIGSPIGRDRRAFLVQPYGHTARVCILRHAFERKEAAAAAEGQAHAWASLNKAEKLGRATELALDCVREILELGIDPSDAKTLSIVKDTALNIISQQIRLDALKELHARGDAAADNGRAEEQRLFDLAFADLQMHQARVIEANTPADGDDEEDRAVDGS